jgi:alpha-tubulin suppressor-like RCC1 family protein
MAALAIFGLPIAAAPHSALATPPALSSISAGVTHTCAVSAAGGAECWGRNASGELGNGNTTQSNSPVSVTGLSSGVQSISAGGDQSGGLGAEHGFTCALLVGGAVTCWGHNGSGQLGNGSTIDSSIPIEVSGLGSGVLAIAAGSYHACALLAAGGARCWGKNNSGQLGNNSNANSSIPVEVSTLGSGVQSISAGDGHSCALLTGGGVKCWGYNFFGQLGNNSTTNTKIPVDVSGLGTDIKAISAGGNHTCALTLALGAAKCWGYNFFGQVGNNSTTNSNVPVDVPVIGFGGLAISAGAAHSCAIVIGGAAKCWGFNASGQVGNNSTANSKLPVNVSGLGSGVQALSAGVSHTCALTSGGSATCWGANLSGQLGNGLSGLSSAPVNVSGLASGVVVISAGGRHSCAVTNAGAAKCWGDNARGQLGYHVVIPDFSDRNVPVDVTGLESGVQSISAGNSHTCALLTGGSAKCWGSNDDGKLGTGLLTFDSLVPADVFGLGSGVLDISASNSHTCALLISEAVKCWGYNGDAELGNNSITSSKIPVDVSGLGIGSGVQAISTGSGHSCALLAGGSAKCWGSNEFGQLGNNSTQIIRVPVDVTVVGANVLSISAGLWHTCAVVTGGGAKCWGDNSSGQLGNGSTTNSLVAVNVNGLASGVQAISVRSRHTCALLIGGAVKCWGLNEDGQLGNNSITSSSIPVAVSGLESGVQAISAGQHHVCVIAGGGAAKCWGLRTSGELGDGAFGYSSGPVDVVFPAAPPVESCPGFANIALANVGANGHVFCGANNPLTTNARAPGVVPDSVTAIFWWNNPAQQFNFWFRGFPNNFQTLTSLDPLKYYFFQATTTGGTIANTGGGTTLAVSGTASISTVGGANGVIWSGGPHATNTLAGYGSITPVTAIFSWNNASQQFNFWFRGFPDNFQTLTAGIERGKYYFFQAPLGQTITMN